MAANVVHSEQASVATEKVPIHIRGKLYVLMMHEWMVNMNVWKNALILIG